MTVPYLPSVSLYIEVMIPPLMPLARLLEDDLVLSSKAFPVEKPNSNGEGPERPDVDPSSQPGLWIKIIIFP